MFLVRFRSALGELYLGSITRSNRILLRTMSSSTPITDSITQKINKDLKPQQFEVINESHLHRNHAPMQGVASKETHFRLNIISEKFNSMNLIQRHRHIYALLGDELKMENGIHALALVTKTPEEASKNQD